MICSGRGGDSGEEGYTDRILSDAEAKCGSVGQDFRARVSCSRVDSAC